MRRFRPVRVLTAAVFALAGLIFFTSFNTAKGTNIRTDASLLKLSDLIQERSHKNGRLDESNATLREDVEALAERDDGSTKAEDDRLAALEGNAGAQKLKGEALTVTLNDAPPNATAKLPGYPEPQPDYLVIHQQDLQDGRVKQDVAVIGDEQVAFGRIEVLKAAVGNTRRSELNDPVDRVVHELQLEIHAAVHIPAF